MNQWIRLGSAAIACSAAGLLLTACDKSTSLSVDRIITIPTVPPTTTPPVAKTKVTLKGRVVDDPIPNASVVATIGRTTVSTVADAAGNYTLPVEVPSTDASLPVLITATGAMGTEQANVKLVSLPGAMSTLVADAGGDAVLTAAENIRSNVTHVSTAESVLVMERTAGAALTTQAQLEDLLKQVDPVALFDLAATIKLIVDTPNYNLPSGVMDTLAFAQNASVRTEYIEEIKEKSPEDLEDAKQDTANSADAVMQTSASDIPSQLYLAVIDNDARRSANSFQFVDALTFAADGTGSYYNAVSFTPTTWTFSSNKLNVVFAEKPKVVGFPTVDTDGDGNPDRQVQAETTTNGYTLVFLSDSLVSVTSNFSTVYPQKEIPDEPNKSETNSATVILPATDFAPFLPASFASNGGKLLTQTYRAQDESLGNSQFSGDILTFSAGGSASGQQFARALNWTLSTSGKLTTTQAGNRVDYQGLAFGFANQDANTDFVFAEVTTAEAKYVDIVKVFRPKSALAFNAATLKGTYYLYGLGNHEAGSAFDGRLMGQSIELNEDRTGYLGTDFVETDPSGNDTVVRPDFNTAPVGFLRWSVEGDGSLLTRRVFDGAQATAKARRSCNPDTNSNCIVTDERRLVPFSLDGVRHYWLELRRTDFTNGVSASTPISYVPRYWDMTSMVNAISGSWVLSFPDDSSRKVVVSFMGNGSYVIGGFWNRPDCKEDSGNASNPDVEQNGNGWEKGQFAWNAGTGRLQLSNVTGTDGDCGFVEGPQANYDDDEFLSFQQDGSLALRCLTPGEGDFCTGITLKRIASVKRQLTGAWKVLTNDTAADGSGLFYFFPDNTYLQVEAGFDTESSSACRNGGIEFGRFTFDAAQGKFEVSGIPFDNTGSDCGLNDGEASDPAFFTFLSDTQARYRYQSAQASEEGELIEKITTP